MESCSNWTSSRPAEDADALLRAPEARAKVYREKLEEIIEWAEDAGYHAVEIAQDALQEGAEAAAKELQRS